MSVAPEEAAVAATKGTSEDIGRLGTKAPGCSCDVGGWNLGTVPNLYPAKTCISSKLFVSSVLSYLCDESP